MMFWDSELVAARRLGGARHIDPPLFARTLWDQDACWRGRRNGRRLLPLGSGIIHPGHQICVGFFQNPASQMLQRRKAALRDPLVCTT